MDTENRQSCLRYMGRDLPYDWPSYHYAELVTCLYRSEEGSRKEIT